MAVLKKVTGTSAVTTVAVTVVTAVVLKVAVYVQVLKAVGVDVRSILVHVHIRGRYRR